MNQNNNHDDDFGQMRSDYPKHSPTKRGPEHRYDKFCLLITASVFISTFFGMNSLLDGEGITRNALVLFVPFALATLSLQANKAAFHTGSKLAATGNPWAIGLVIGWFALMAVIVSTIGVGGISRDIVESARLRIPIAEMSDASLKVEEAASKAQRVVPLLISSASDIQSVGLCERTVGCVTGRPGSGSQVTTLMALAGKINRVTRQYKEAGTRRSKLTKRLNGLASKYEAQLSKEGATGKSRATLLAIYTQAQSLVTQISSVVPTAATRGLSSELRTMQVAPARPGRIDVAARLQGHADRLDEALAGVSNDTIALSAFPTPSGIAAGWGRLDLIWPLALTLIGLELILIVLWLLMLLDFRARIGGLEMQEAQPAVLVATPEPDAMNGRRGMIGFPRSDQSSRSNGDAS